MTNEEKWIKRKSAFLALTSKQKVLFSPFLAHEITVGSRAAYPGELQINVAIERLVLFNELQHNVTSQIAHLLTDEKRYPDDVLLEILIEKAKSDDWASLYLESAFDLAFSRLSLET